MTRPAALPISPAALLTLGLLALGGIGGALMSLTPSPMPWLMGSLFATGLVAAFRGRDFPSGYAFPARFRFVFTAIVGALIGGRIDPDMLARVSDLWKSLATVSLFVVLAHVWNYQLFRRLAGYDRQTAFFAGTPGGLIESMEMGAAHGADVRLLTLQHYWRIILVIVLVPAGLSLLHGEVLGSAGGMRLSADARGDLSGLPVLALVAAAGLLGGRALGLPAAPLVGPLALAAAGSALGVFDLHSPAWVVALAQVVIGVSIGARFIGVTARMVRRSIGYALISVVGMMSLGGLLAVITAPLVGEGVEVMFISMAPGGAIEMGLVALSLSVNPAFVAFHHLYRIAFAVLDLTLASRWMGLAGAAGGDRG